MLTIGLMILSGIAGSVIEFIFHKKIDADAAKIVAAFNTEMAALRATHTAAAVKAVAPTTSQN